MVQRIVVPIAAFLLAAPAPAGAQLLDTIGSFLRVKPRISVIVDTRGSFISNRNVRIMGVKLGLEHGGRVRYGIGYNFLISPIERDQAIGPDGNVVTTHLRFGYVAPYFGYTFFVRRHWEVSIPVQFGIGSGSLVYRDEGGARRRSQRTTVVLYEPAMQVQYRLIKYAAIYLGWGYRLVARTSASLNEQFTAPIYLLGLKVHFGDIYRDLHGGSSRSTR
ncbi:MAG: hypothetical protein H6595_04945 [Flavobacteriales bacterium]|nr:hypothetical protein [Flavobacteriales bacterium]MCB9166809.1 hypothetical protein [Flavobacteriales bacterium]